MSTPVLSSIQCKESSKSSTTNHNNKTTTTMSPAPHDTTTKQPIAPRHLPNRNCNPLPNAHMQVKSPRPTLNRSAVRVPPTHDKQQSNRADVAAKRRGTPMHKTTANTTTGLHVTTVW